VRNYVRHPLSKIEFSELFEKLSNSPSDLVRDRHQVETWEDVVAHLIKHPKAMQRPIVVLGKQAVLARPAQNMESLFED
jgi:arsenate reductase